MEAWHRRDEYSFNCVVVEDGVQIGRRYAVAECRRHLCSGLDRFGADIFQWHVELTETGIEVADAVATGSYEGIGMLVGGEPSKVVLFA